MSTSKNIVSGSVEQFQEFEKTLNGISKSDFHKRRKEAIKSFELLGLPDRKTENYKYTPVTNRLNKTVELTFSPTESKDPTDLNLSEIQIPDLDAIQVFIHNGRFHSVNNEEGELPKGIEIVDFHEAYHTHSNVLDKHFGHYAKINEDAFTAINTAFASQGVLIIAEKGVVLEKPIAIYHVSDQPSGTSQSRVLTVCEENSQLSLIEDFISLGENTSFVNTVTEIVVHQNAILNYHKLETRNQGLIHVGNTHIEQVATSTVNVVTITLEGKLTRNNLNLVLDDEHCEANMYGLYITSGDQHTDNQTMVDHRKPNSISNELYKGVMAGNSTAVFNGKIFVRQDAQKTNAFQSNKNILLSDQGSINAKPQLEIWADDVKCSHGATTGKLDDEQLFYLQSRGIGKEEARALLLYAFATDILEKIGSEALRNHIDQEIQKALKNTK